MNREIYIDNNATTPLNNSAGQLMAVYLAEEFGNPSCAHSVGRRAKNALTIARENCARYLDCDSDGIIFTSGGTEADNIAIAGPVRSGQIRRIITVRTEHPAVLRSCEALEENGIEIVYVGVSPDGTVHPSIFEKMEIDDRTLVSVMLANNEVGTIQRVAEIAGIVHGRGGLVHTDAVQAFGKIPVSFRELDVDMMSLSAHKFHGPKGAGILARGKNVLLAPFIHGGGQEHGIRSGTENIPAIVGMAEAMRIAAEKPCFELLANMKMKFLELIMKKLDNVSVNGNPDGTLPNTVNLCFEGVPANLLVIRLDLNGVRVSSGAACHSGAETVSHVLKAMGMDEERAASSVRISFSRRNTLEEIEMAAEIIADSVRGMINNFD